MLSSLKNQLLLGIDAGGTHTEAVITDESGFVLGRSRLEYGSNPHNADVMVSYQVILKVVAAAREDMRFNHADKDADRHFDATCIGLAGFDTESDRRYVTKFISSLPESDELFHNGRVTVVNNGYVALRAGTDHPAGICLSVGTGANCYGITTKGTEHTAGGWGYLLGDQGSGYYLGRALLRQALREHDGRALHSPVSTVLLRHLNLSSADELVDWAYMKGKPNIPEVAALASLYDDPELADSIEISRIVTEGIEQVFESYRTVIGALSLRDTKQLPVICTGGVLSRKGRYTEKLMQSIRNLTPQAEIIFPSKSSAEGAVKVAQMSVSAGTLPTSALTVVNPKRR